MIETEHPWLQRAMERNVPVEFVMVFEDHAVFTIKTDPTQPGNLVFRVPLDEARQIRLRNHMTLSEMLPWIEAGIKESTSEAYSWVLHYFPELKPEDLHEYDPSKSQEEKDSKNATN